MPCRRVAISLLLSTVLVSLTILFCSRGRVVAGPSVTASAVDSLAVGYVYYDGVPVAGADVAILRDGVVVYTATTAIGASGVPSFTVDLFAPPVGAVSGEILVLTATYGVGEANLTHFQVDRTTQDLAVWLSSVCGDTEITDATITTNTTWTPACGPYYLRTNLQVAAGVTLTITAGTTIEVDADRALQVNGTLLSSGVSNALVAFVPGQGLPWGYVSLAGGASGSQLQGTLLEYAGSVTVDHNAALRVDGVSAVLDGIIVRQSETDGIQVFNDAAVRMAGLTVVDNQGHGIFVESNDSALSIQNSTVSDNDASGITVQGGASGTVAGNVVARNGNRGISIWNDNAGPVTVAGNWIVDNQAAYGGGIYFVYAYGTIEDNFIARNEATRRGGGIQFQSSSIAESQIARNYIISNTSFYETVAGGGIHLYGRNVTINNNVFALNSAARALPDWGGQGGALYIDAYQTSGLIQVNHNSFVYNLAEGGPGAALYARDPQVLVEGNTVVANTAFSSPSDDWGAVHLQAAIDLNYNNLHNNNTYDVYNGTPLANGTVNAQSNWWGTADSTAISGQIYDWFDNAARSIVDFSNWLTEPWTVAPVAPPLAVGTTVVGSSIHVAWPANSEADLAGYKIYLSSYEELYEPAVAGEIQGIDVGAATSFTLSCMMPDKYFVAVTAYDHSADAQDDWTDGNESWFSPEVDAKTVVTPTCGMPSPPTNLLATGISASAIDLSWVDVATDETSYRLERSPDGSNGWVEIAHLGPDASAYRDNGLACGTAYHYRVRAHRLGDDQFSAYAGPTSGTTVACTPAAPSALSAVAVSASQIDLAWTDNGDDETGYRIERSPNGSSDWSEIAAVAADSTAYSDDGLTCESSYYYRVRAYRASDGQYSGYSNIDGATTLACTPAAPTGLTATPISMTQIDLAWTDNADDETAYQVQRSPDGGTGWTEIAALGADASSFSDIGLSCGTTNYYRVRAYRANDGQFSPFSNVASATTLACPLPAPTDLTATPISGSQINLGWTDNAGDETGYRVERSPHGATAWVEIASLSANSTSFSDVGLSCGATYYYRVRAFRGGDGQYSPYSNVASAATIVCPPLAPGDLVAASHDPEQIELSWTDNAGDETAYLVERSSDGVSGWTEIASLGANVTGFTDQGLVCGQTYHYRVRAHRASDGQYSTYSNSASATAAYFTSSLPVIIRP